jgi:hypothetical protein
MKKILSAVILLAGFYCSNGQNQIVGYEYWFDNQYDQKTKTYVTPAEQWMTDLSIPVNDLATGMHIFSFRSVDNKGKYSSPLSYFFYKIPEQSSSNRKEILAWEYWFDNDYIDATIVNASGMEHFSIDEWIDLKHLPTGIHTLNIRFKDNSQIWSSVYSQFIYKNPERTSSTGREIIAYEYWFDNNYSDAVFINMPGKETQNLNEFIPLNNVPTGFHAFNIRFLDNSNLWSSPLSHFIYKVSGQENLNENSITEYQYWFDNKFEQVSKVKLPTPLKHLNLIDNLDLTQVSKGSHTIHFQFKDTLGLWSVVTTDTIVKLPLPLADFSFQKTANCDSTTLTFTDHSIDADKYYWSFGDENNSGDKNPIHSYFTAGNYTITLTITDTATGLENVISKQFSVIPNDFSVSHQSNILTANAASGIYQWLDCNNQYEPLQGETNQIFIPKVPGRYAVEITQNGCTDTSICYIISTVDIIENSFNQHFMVYPNPTDGKVLIDLGMDRQNIRLAVHNLEGKLIMHRRIRDTRIFEIDIDEPAGIFFLTITSGKQSATLKLIKK